VVIFEGRDAAGKGGAIKRITQRLNPRVCRVAALPAPNERERTIVLISMSNAPGDIVSAMLPDAKTASSTTAPFGSIVMMKSASRAAAPLEDFTMPDWTLCTLVIEVPNAPGRRSLEPVLPCASVGLS
jgi:hypothetical protein